MSQALAWYYGRFIGLKVSFQWYKDRKKGCGILVDTNETGVCITEDQTDKLIWYSHHDIGAIEPFSIPDKIQWKHDWEE